MKSYQLEPAEARPTEQSQLHIARRTRATSTVASPNSGAGPVRAPLPEARRPSEPVPIWLAVLLATPCHAHRNGENHAVRWNWVSGRALYTNAGGDAEHIQPLGVYLMGGHTVAVCWMPGETAYTVEVYRQTERYA